MFGNGDECMKDQKELYKILKIEKNIDEIQKYFKEVLSIRGFDTKTAQDKVLLLTEELGELAKAVRKSETNIAVDYARLDSYDTVEGEIADVFIVLISLCNLLGIDLHNAVLAKESKNVNREWK